MGRHNSITNVFTQFGLCRGTSKEGIPDSKRVLSILKDVGCEFYYVTPESPFVITPKSLSDHSLVKAVNKNRGDEDSVEVTNEAGDIEIGSAIINDALSPESAPDLERGTARFNYRAQDKVFMLKQAAGVDPEGEEGTFTSTSQIDGLALKHQQFAARLFQVFRPEYGWTGQLSSKALNTKSILSAELSFIYWANYFGPWYVKTLDRTFLLRAPAWKVQDLNEAGVILVSTESFCDWWRNSNKELVKYFQQKFPEIR